MALRTCSVSRSLDVSSSFYPRATQFLGCNILSSHFLILPPKTHSPSNSRLQGLEEGARQSCVSSFDLISKFWADISNNSKDLFSWVGFQRLTRGVGRAEPSSPSLSKARLSVEAE